MDTKQRLLPLAFAVAAVGCGADDHSSNKSVGDDALARASKNEEVAAQLSAKSPVFQPGDTAISISSSGFWSGSYGFSSEFADLSKRQIEALSDFSWQDNPDDCWRNSLGHRIQVTTADGEVREYYSDSEDAGCRDDISQLVNFNAVQNFYEESGCVSSLDLDGGWDADNALAATLNRGCHHGYFYGPVWFKLEVLQSSELVIEGLGCRHSGTYLALFDRDGKTLLAQGEATDYLSGCRTIQYPISKPGAYYLQALGYSGDSYFKAYTRN